jgi:hypothetical protein
MTRSKIVLVPFPFDDLSTDKVRPAVCLHVEQYSFISSSSCYPVKYFLSVLLPGKSLFFNKVF